MKKKILFVDDETAILFLMKETFSLKGYEVFTATNALEALSILKENTIPIIVTDIQMPGLSGVELCKRIREFNHISVVIAMTGFGNFFELTNCRDSGFDDYIRKPFAPEDMAEIVEYGFKRFLRWSALFAKV